MKSHFSLSFLTEQRFQGRKCTYQTSGANAGKFSVSWSNNSTNPSNLTIKDEYFKLSGNYDNEVQCLKQWLNTRMEWLKRTFDSM